MQYSMHCCRASLEEGKGMRRKSWLTCLPFRFSRYSHMCLGDHTDLVRWIWGGSGLAGGRRARLSDASPREPVTEVTAVGHRMNSAMALPHVIEFRPLVRVLVYDVAC